ncbi:MAG: GAF domain-containing protein, partial [Betaproteobacteria bacterium]
GVLNEALRAEVGERRRAEQVVRGQAAIILRSLDTIRDQSSVEAFVEEVLKTIVEQLGGMGAALWMPEQGSGVGRVVLDFDLHGFRRGDAIDHPGRSPRRMAHLHAGHWDVHDPGPIVLDADYIDTDPSYADFRAWAQRLGIRTVLVLPLVYGGESNGVLAIRFGREQMFSTDELRLTRALALHATLALQLARLGDDARETAVLREREEAARRRAADLSNANAILQDALQYLTSEPELNSFLAFVLRSVVECFGAHSSSLQVQNAEGTRIWFLQTWENGRLHSAEEYRHSPLGRAYEEASGFELRRKVYAVPEAHFVTDVQTAPTVTPSITDALRTIGVQSLANIPLLLGSRVIGRLIIRFDSVRSVGADDLQLMQSIANQMAIAMHTSRLAVEGRSAAILQERTRMAREIHDTLAQGFTGVIVQLEAAKDAIALHRATDADGRIERAGALARHSLTEARRSVHALRPLALEHGNLAAALSSLLEAMTAGTGIRVSARSEGDAFPIPLDWEDDLLRIGQEALTNALKHGAPTRIEWSLRYSPAEIVLDVFDDGVGFDAGQATDGMGLVGMRERCARMGGRLDLETAPGRGVRVRVTLALEC